MAKKQERRRERGKPAEREIVLERKACRAGEIDVMWCVV